MGSKERRESLLPAKLGLDHNVVTARLNRPTWHCASTAELAAALGISFSCFANWIQRLKFIPPEPRHLYRLRGNRNVYRVDKVGQWLSGVPLSEQAMQYLVSVGLQPPSSATGDLWSHVTMLEGSNVFTHVWRPYDLNHYLSELMKQYEVSTISADQ